MKIVPQLHGLWGAEGGIKSTVEGTKGKKETRRSGPDAWSHYQTKGVLNCRGGSVG